MEIIKIKFAQRSANLVKFFPVQHRYCADKILFAQDNYLTKKIFIVQDRFKRIRAIETILIGKKLIRNVFFAFLFSSKACLSLHTKNK